MNRFLRSLLVITSLTLLSIAPAHASQQITKIVLRNGVTVSAGVLDSSAAFGIKGASKLRIVMWASDIDSTIAVSTSIHPNGSCLGVAFDVGDTNVVKSYISTGQSQLPFVSQGLALPTFANGASIRYRPSVDKFVMNIEYVPIDAGQAGIPNRFGPLSAKWYTKLLGGAVRDLHVVAYVYYENP